MSKSKILKNTVNYHEELIEFLKNPKEADLYLRIAMEEYQEDGDTDLLLVALRNITEARGGMGKLSKKTHLNRQNLYNILSKNGNPTLGTFGLILNELGYKLSIEPKVKKAG
jgi:probable addiction module antidote protein